MNLHYRHAAMRPRVIAAFLFGALLTTSLACRERASATGAPAGAAAVKEQITWRKLGEWSGTGSQQTDSFTSDSGMLRIHWKTTAQPGAAPPGSFLLTLHSSISGRALVTAVDEKGPREETTFVSPDPHVFFARIEATGLDWRFSVDEGYSGPVVSR